MSGYFGPAALMEQFKNKLIKCWKNNYCKFCCQGQSSLAINFLDTTEDANQIGFHNLRSPVFSHFLLSKLKWILEAVKNLKNKKAWTSQQYQYQTSFHQWPLEAGTQLALLLLGLILDQSGAAFHTGGWTDSSAVLELPAVQPAAGSRFSSTILAAPNWLTGRPDG